METRTKRQRISRLLIVEDDESQLRSLTAIMESDGFEVVGCSNASDALERLRVLDVGVAIVDLRLGDMSGEELLQRLSAYSDRVRLIINTGYSSYDTAKEALNVGAFAYVEKAGDPDELVRHVHRAFRAGFHSYAEELEEAVAERTRNLLEVNKALEQALNRLNLHVDSSPLAVVEWDADFHIVRWGGTGEQVFGWTADEVVGKRIDELPWVYEEDLAGIEQVTAEMLSGKRLSNVNKNRNVRKDGAVIHCEWYSTAICDESGRLVSVLSHVVDVTEHKETEAALRDSEDRLHAFMDNLPGLSFISDPGKSMLYANKHMIDVYGLKPEEVLNRDFQEYNTPAHVARNH